MVRCARALTNGDGCRRRLASPAKKPSRSVTEHLHQCPRSTMAVLSLGMGADRVRFSARAQAVTTARCPRAVPVVTAVQCGYFSRREAGPPSRASRVRISVPALVARPSSKRCSASKFGRHARRYASKAARCGGNLPSFHRWVRFPLLARTTRGAGSVKRIANPLGSVRFRGASPCSYCGNAARGLLSRSGQARLLVGAPRGILLAARKLASHVSNAGSIPACLTMSLPADPALSLRTTVAVVRLHPGTPTALARGSSAAPPKRGSAVRLSTRAPRGSSNESSPGPSPGAQANSVRIPSHGNGDNARRDAALIRPAAVVRVHVSPLRDRLAAGQLRFERRRRAFESCARNPRGARRLVTAPGLHPGEKSSILLLRTIFSAHVA